LSFSFDVIRVWQRPVDEILSGGIGTLSLAPLAAVQPDRLPAVIRQIEERFEREASPSVAEDLWSATFLLMGLRYDEAMARLLLRGVGGMRDSVTYQAILAEGREEGREEGRAESVHDLLLEYGTVRFGPPQVQIRAALDDVAQTLIPRGAALRMASATSWADLVAPVAG
jgi:hypothetical protein